MAKSYIVIAHDQRTIRLTEDYGDNNRGAYAAVATAQKLGFVARWETARFETDDERETSIAAIVARVEAEIVFDQRLRAAAAVSPDHDADDWETPPEGLAAVRGHAV